MFPVCMIKLHRLHDEILYERALAGCLAPGGSVSLSVARTTKHPSVGSCAAQRSTNPRRRSNPRAPAGAMAGWISSKLKAAETLLHQASAAPPSPSPVSSSLPSPALLTIHSSSPTDRPAGGGVARQVLLRLRPHRPPAALVGRAPRRPRPAQAAAGDPASLPRPPHRRQAPLPASPSAPLRPPPLRLRRGGSLGAGSARC